MTQRPPQIIAMGGGGFSMEPDNPALDRYILAQTGKEQPGVLFLPTASGDSPVYINNFYAAFTRLPCRPSHLTFFARTPDLETMLMAQDVIYVGGGNTKSMLGVWREWGLPEILRTAWQSGVVLAGLSAGAICWFECGLTDSWAGDYHLLPGLGFLPGSCCPHYDGEADRPPAFRGLVGSGEAPPGIALQDGAAAHYIDDRLVRVAASRPQARAYSMERKNSQAVEIEIDTVYLGETTL